MLIVWCDCNHCEITILRTKQKKHFGKRYLRRYIRDLLTAGESKTEKISLLSMELMIDIVASALTFEHWASTQQQEQGARLCRSQSTSSTHSTDSDSNTRIYRQNMPHLERPIVPHMRLIESLPNLSLYDA